MRLFRLFRKDFACEVEDWVRAGLIETAQGEAILARYGMGLKDARRASLGYYVLTALAALFAGLALILVISHNWDDLPRLTRMLGLICLTLAVNLQGMRLTAGGRDKAGALWLFFGSICYGASIMLIAQIYHLGEHFPDGIFYWTLGTLPLVFITRTRLNALLCLVLATVWMAVESRAGFFPALYPLFALSCIWLAFIRKDSALLFLGGLGGCVIWFNLLLAWIASGWRDYDVNMDQLPATIALGLLLTGLAWRLLRSPDHGFRDYGQLLHLWLQRCGIIVLLALSFEVIWRNAAREHYDLGLFSPLFLAFCATAGCFLARPSGGKALGPLLVYGAFFTLAFSWVYLGNVNVAVLAAAVNLLLAATGIWLIRRGIDDAVTHFFYTGVIVLLLTALFRYFDLIGDYIGGAVLFMAAAGVMFGAARYWRTRMVRQEADHV